MWDVGLGDQAWQNAELNLGEYGFPKSGGCGRLQLSCPDQYRCIPIIHELSS
jgi:hypothetical protein